MLTDREMKTIAERYLEFIILNSDSNIELALYDNRVKKDYGNLFIYQSKNYIETGDEKYLLGGNALF